VHDNRNRILVSALGLSVLFAASTFASVSGKVSFDGELPPETAIKMNADPKCVEIHAGEEVLTNYFAVGEDGGLANVFVWIKDAPEGEYPVPAEPVVISQKGCVYFPVVSGIRVDQTLRIENNDDNLHNVRALARTNRPFNLGQPSKGVREKTFKLPEEAVKFKCDVHPWMQSWMFVLEHPFFAVTDEHGTFEISGLPPGTYTLLAWHEKLGQQESSITVGSDGTAGADFVFTAE